MKNIIFSSIVGFALIAFTGCTTGNDVETAKCQASGKCANAKKMTKKCASGAKCGK
jgi:hypothetical protein